MSNVLKMRQPFPQRLGTALLLAVFAIGSKAATAFAKLLLRHLGPAFFTVALAMGASMDIPAYAGDLAAPSGRVLLTIEGKIRNTTDGTRAMFDRAQLEALGMSELETSNPFLQGTHKFDGVLFSKILDAVGADGTMIEAIALDEYSVDIPIKDVRDYPVLLAMKWNGKVMRIRSKGPIWIVYPVDQFPELQFEEYSTRSIWQLVTLRIK